MERQWFLRTVKPYRSVIREYNLILIYISCFMHRKNGLCILLTCWTINRLSCEDRKRGCSFLDPPLACESFILSQFLSSFAAFCQDRLTCRNPPLI